jgi:hypothetical protein
MHAPGISLSHMKQMESSRKFFFVQRRRNAIIRIQVKKEKKKKKMRANETEWQDNYTQATTASWQDPSGLNLLQSIRYFTCIQSIKRFGI